MKGEKLSIVIATNLTSIGCVYKEKGIESLPQIQFFEIPISLQPDNVNLRYFKLRLFDITACIVWNIKGLWHFVAKISKLENRSLWQRLNSFVKNYFTKNVASIRIQKVATYNSDRKKIYLIPSWTLRSSLIGFFNNFLLIDATDKWD